MPTEQAGIPLNSVIAQQRHAHDANGQTPQPRPRSLPVAVIAALKPDIDSGALRTIGKAIGCILRPYPIDDANPHGSRRRITVALAATVVTAASTLIVVWQRR